MSIGIANIQVLGPAPAPAVPGTSPPNLLLPDATDGVMTGFDASTFPAGAWFTDPYFTKNTFTLPGASWIAQPGVPVQQVAPQPGTPNPGTQYALQITVPNYVSYEILAPAPIIPISPSIANSFANMNTGQGPYFYIDGWVWVPSTTSSLSAVPIAFYGLDNDGNTVAGFYAPYSSNILLPTTPGAWRHSSATVRLEGITLTGNWTLATHLAASIIGFDMGGATIQLAALQLTIPTLQPLTGLYVSLSPGIFSQGGLTQTFGGYTQQIAAANSTNPRIDVLAWNVFTRQIDYFEGTAAASPVAPQVGVYDVPLWQVYVPAGATSLQPSNLTDLRVRAGLYYDTAGNAFLRGATVSLTPATTPAGTATGAPAYASLAAAYSNATTGDLSTGTGVSFTALTATARVWGTMRVANNTLGDGVLAKVWLSTAAVPAQGAAPGASDTEQWQTTTTQEGLAGNPNTVAFDFQISGLTVGTTYYVYLSIAAVTGGTATVSGGHNETTIQAQSV